MAKTVAKAKTRKLEATEGHILPVHFKGKIVVIRPGKPIEFDWEELDYQSRIHLEAALESNELRDWVEPAAKPEKLKDEKPAPAALASKSSA